MATFTMAVSPRLTKSYRPRASLRVEDYRSLFRFNEVNVEWIASHFISDITTNQETRGGALSTKAQMQVFLRYMSDPGFQVGVAEDIGVDRTTVSKTVKKVMSLIISKAPLWIKFPKTNAELQLAKDEWQRRFKMPSCIGALDCTHVKISKPGPKFHGDDYINRKQQATINVQATCNAKEEFTSVDASWPGSVHDSRIWSNSSESQFMQSTRDTILIADSGYGITPWLITPYKNPTIDAEKNFNQIYAKERVIIERCFGQVKRRFPILQYKVRVQLKHISKIIICCFVLHNVAKYLSDPEDDFTDILEDADEDEAGDTTHNLLNGNRIRNLGQQKRNNLAEMLHNNP